MNGGGCAEPSDDQDATHKHRLFSHDYRLPTSKQSTTAPSRHGTSLPFALDLPPFTYPEVD